jgi:hypothetical protein
MPLRSPTVLISATVLPNSANFYLILNILTPAVFNRSLFLEHSTANYILSFSEAP